MSADMAPSAMRRPSFVDRHPQVHVGVITRCNPKTASVDSDRAAWSVPYGALRQVLDV